MQIEVVTPAAPESRNGNRVTASRWARLLERLGHQVTVTTAWSGVAVDVLVALHARRSAAAVRDFAAAHPDRPVVVALTGTDLYQDLPDSVEVHQSLRLARALVVLQTRAKEAVPASLRERVHVIHQSVTVPQREPQSQRQLQPEPQGGAFAVLFLAHLRQVKDPVLVGAATRLLPSHSRVLVTHLGAALDREWEEWAQAETADNPRYRWEGDVARSEALRRLAEARLLVLTSRTEGGANVVSEAIAVGTPVLSTRVEGSVGLLGEDYPGYVTVGDAPGLAVLLERAETDPVFYAELQERVTALRHLVDPVRERQAWADLLSAIGR
jgi:putative glycosyltransferase (TIGR04348 family)